MSQALAFYEGHSFYEGLTWSSVRELIGHSLRERYQVPKELPARLLALVRKLETIESKSARAQTLIGTLLEARTVAGVKAFPDWYVLT